MKLELFPILILLAVLIVVTIKRINLKNMRSVKWVFAVYAAVLLLSVVVLYMLPHEGFAVSNNDPAATADIFQAARTGTLELTPGVTAKGHWSFAYNAGRLEIAAEPDPVIWTRRKDTDDGKIDVIYYVAKSSFDGVDYTDQIKSPTVKLVGNKLIITNPAPYQIDLARFAKDLTGVQFFGDRVNRPMMGPREVLFFQIPKSVNIDDTDKRIQFVGE